MSKVALAPMTQCLGREHVRQNIRLNAARPNEVDTPMIRFGLPSVNWMRIE
jgi:2-keto-3-deoxy-L-fuconate dehydrogenase